MLTPTATIAIIFIVALLVGFVVGWIYAEHRHTDRETQLQTLVAIAVTLVWVGSVISGIFISGYTVSPMIHALMGAIVGYFFTKDGINFDIGGE